MIKKIIIIVSIIILIGIIGYFFLRPYLDNNPNDGLDNQITPPSNGSAFIPQTNIDPSFIVIEEKLTPLSNKGTISYWIKESDNSIFYILDTGKIYKILENQEAESFSNLTFVNINKVIPSPSGEMAIVQFEKENFRVFNTNSKSWRSLPEGASSVAWSPDSKKIAYINKSTSGIYTFTLNSERSSKILTLNSLDLELVWQNPNELYLITKPSNKNIGSILGLDLTNKKVRTIIKGRGLMANWSPDGSVALIFDNAKGLHFVNANGTDLQKLSFLSLPDKCYFTENTILCGAPESLKINDLPDLYLQKGLYTIDSLFEINFKEGQTAILFDSRTESESIDIWHPQRVGNTIYFINRYDTRLYSLDIE